MSQAGSGNSENRGVTRVRVDAAVTGPARGQLEQLSCSGSLPRMTLGRHAQAHGEEKMAMLEMETPLSADLEINLDSIPRDLLVLLRHALHGLQYGNVTLVVHDGHIVQLDRIEHTRHKRTAKSR